MTLLDTDDSVKTYVLLYLASQVYPSLYELILGLIFHGPHVSRPVDELVAKVCASFASCVVEKLPPDGLVV